MNLNAIEPSDLEETKKIHKEVTISSTDKSSEPISMISRSLEYECDRDTLENDGVQCDVMKPNCEFSVARREIFPAKAIQGDSNEDNCSFENAKRVQAVQAEQNKEACEEQKFVCEASDILNCHLPTTGSHEKLDDRSVDSGMLSFVSPVLQPSNKLTNGQQETGSACFVTFDTHQMEAPLDKRELGNSDGSFQVSSAGNARAVLAEEVVHHMRTEINDKSCHQPQQTTRNCSLVSEMSGSHYRKLLADTTGGSSSTTKPGVKSNTSNNKPVPTTRPGRIKLLAALPVPDTGLHLNSLAASAEDKIAEGQTLTCRRHIISSSTTVPSNPVISNAKHPIIEMASEVEMKEETGEQNNGFQVSGNVSEESILVEDVEFPLSSPKKRRISDIMGETESCKHCNCKKSKCLKLYCECFAAGFYCVEPCNCQDCFNKPIHKDTVLEARRLTESRNPLAFAPKVIRSSDTPNNMDELSKTPASAHDKGCNCRKSGCIKKYCECFRVAVGCSLSCRCEGCKNTFGCKERSESIVYQETKFVQRNASDVSSVDNVPGTDKENHDSVTPELTKDTRLENFPGNNNSIEEVAEEDALQTSRSDSSLHTSPAKSASPICKRIPPHCEFEASPGWSYRKLILRSILPLPIIDEEQKLPSKLQ